MIEEKDILRGTHYGLHIYSYILSLYYPDTVVLELSGKQCKPTRNPLNGNQPTLHISNQDNVFCYQDADLSEFNGNPFDFAALHYQLKGDELLQKINEDLNLHIGEEKGFYSNDQSKVLVPAIVMATPKFSYYRCPVANTLPSAEISLPDAWKVIKGSRYKPRTLELRGIKEAEKASKYKRTLFDYVTFSGVFTKRGDSALVNHSGLLTLDFDHVENLTQLKETLLADPYFETELMFVSPSGDGLKWIISIDLKQSVHKRWFAAVEAYLKTKYGLEVDKSGKDISRACFLPHDPEVYINPIWIPRIKADSTEPDFTA